MAIYYNTYSINKVAASTPGGTNAAYGVTGSGSFDGTIDGTTLTITAMLTGSVVIGAQIVNSTVTWGTKILAQLSGTTGGAGTYTVSVSQTITTKTSFSAAVTWDYYINNASTQYWGQTGVGANKNKITWAAYSPAVNAIPPKPYLPGINDKAAPNAPAIVGNVITPIKVAVINTTSSYDIVSAYGGSGVPGTTVLNAPVLQWKVSLGGSIIAGTDIVYSGPSWLSISAAPGITSNSSSGVLSLYNYNILTATITNPTLANLTSASDYNFTVTFSDNGNSAEPAKSAQLSFTISLSSGAADLTAATVPAYAANTLLEFSSITPFVPVSANGTGNAPINYALRNSDNTVAATLPDGLSWDDTKGEISGVPREIISSPKTFSVRLTDKYFSTTGKSASSTFTIKVNPPIPTIKTITADKSITQKITIPDSGYVAVTATGGYGALTFSMKNTTPLPDGLTITTSNEVILGETVYKATISGSAKNYSDKTGYFIVVKDSNLIQQSAELEIKITVIALPKLQANQTIAVVDLPLNTPVSGLIPITANPAGYGDLTWSISPSTLPAGLSFANGVISGTPSTITPSSNYTVTISDSSNSNPPSSASFNIGVSVKDITLEILSPKNSYISLIGIPSPGFRPIKATGGYNNLSFTTIPALSAIGLSIDNSGYITGTPNLNPSTVTLPITYTYKVIVTDSLPGSPQTKNESFELTIKGPDPLSANTLITPLSLTTGTSAGTKIPVQGYGGYVTATEKLAYKLYGSGYTISVPGTEQTLTAYGLSFDGATGAITGTPTGPLTSTSYYVQIQDAYTNKQTAYNTFSLSIAYPALTVVYTPSATLTRTVEIPTATTLIPVKGQGGGTGLGTPPTPTYTYKLYGPSYTPSVPGAEQSLSSYGLTFSGSTGAITGTPSLITTGAASYVIEVKDNAQQIQYRTFNLTIVNANNIPIVPGPTTSLVLKRDKNSGNIAPITANGGNPGGLTFTLKNAAGTSVVSLSSYGLTYQSNGQITGTPDTNLSSTTYTAYIADTTGQFTTVQFQLSIVDPTPLHLITTPPDSIVKDATDISFTPVAVDPNYPGESPYTFEIKTGTLPSALTLNPVTGVITGVPGSTGTTSIIIKVTDSAKQVTDSDAFNIVVINKTAITTTVSADNPFTKRNNVQVTTFIPVSASGGYKTLTYKLRNSNNTADARLPTGLNFNELTGEIYGTPTVIDEGITYTVSVSDKASQTSTKTFQLRISPPDLTATLKVASSDIMKRVGTSDITLLEVKNGYTPYTYRLFTSGTTTDTTLPSGLTFTNGVISGIPDTGASVGTTTYDIKVTDHYGSWVIVPGYSLTISPLPALVTSIIDSNSNYADPANLTFYRQKLITPYDNTGPGIAPVKASGGYGTITFGITPSIASMGLTFNPLNGLITGTPNAIYARKSYIISAKDSYNDPSTQTVTIGVDYPPLVITPIKSSYSFTKDLAITDPDDATKTRFQTVTVSGGSGNYKEITFSPSLVSGLTFTTIGPYSGYITGTPSADTNTTYTITVKDNITDLTASCNYDIIVTDAPLLNAIEGPEYPTDGKKILTINTPFAPFKPVAYVGGGGKVKFSISPDIATLGLSFNEDTGIISGVPTTLLEAASPNYGTIPYTITVTDQLVPAQTDSLVINLMVIPTPLVLSAPIPTMTLTRYSGLPSTGLNPIIRAKDVANLDSGQGTASFSISPLIPTGLKFSSDGKITGTPSDPQSKTIYTVTVNDSYDGIGYSAIHGPQVATLTFTIEVLNSPPPKLTLIVPNSTVSAKAGVDFAGIIPVTTKDGEGGFQTLTYKLSDENGNVTTPPGPDENGSIKLPSDVSFSKTNGAITGVGLLTTAGKIYTVTVSDEAQQSASAKFTFEILSNNPTPGLGFTGSRGYWGSVGYTGSSGAATYRGYTGSVGFAGSRGAYDAVGFTGSGGGTGFTGSKGTGFTGSAGFVGSASTIVGYAGSRGLVGYTGSDGAYAGKGYTGSASTEVGYTGSIGDPGPPGGTGGRGLPGEDGYTGSVGFTGSQGIDGLFAGMGYTGSQGDKGYSGSVGFSGSRGLAGYAGSASTIPGYAGSEGTVGFTGSQGIDGAYAAVGFTGSQGNLGYWGSRGYSGSVGIGYTGSASTVVGYSGSQGDLGYSGSRGIPGYSGSASTVIGFTGSVGFAGSRGAYDAVGFTGSQGDKGYSGSQGVGFTGSIGSGYTGSASTVRGYSGSVGFTGSRGAYDAVGFTGSQGDAGYIGSIGRTGGSFSYVAEQGAGSSEAGGGYRVVYKNCVQFDRTDATQVTLIEINCLDIYSTFTPNFFTTVVNSVTNDIKGQLYISSDTYTTVYNVTDIARYITLGLPSEFTFSKLTVEYVSGYTGIFGGARVDISFSPYGQQGYTGSSGFTGSASTVIGFSGSVGDKGFTGSRGAYDAVGFTGSIGDLGYSGSVGFTGSQGVGFTGSASTVAGYTGSVGFAGSRGAYDAVGFTGSEGIGYAGSVGRTGGGFQYVAQIGAGTAGSGNYRVAYYNSLQINNANATLATIIEINCLDLFNTYTPNFFTTSINSVSGPIRGYLYISSDSYLTVYKVTANASLIVVAGTGDTLDYTRLTVAYLSGYSGIFDGSIVNVTYVPYGQIGYSGSVGFTGSASTVIGFTGSFGNTGYTGSDGAYAAVGFTGSQGDLGYSGSLGYWGSRGYSGSVGFVGSASTVIGFSGSQGYYGSVGYTGSVGFVGSASTIRGYSGSWGYFGSTGYTGSSGAYAGKGYTGSKGYSSYYYSDTPPTDPLIAGDRWFNLDVGLELIWVEDASSSQWVEVVASGGIGFTGYTGSQSTIIGYTGSQPSIMTLNSQTSAYTLQASDDTRMISITTGGVTVPSNVMSPGMTVSIYNNSLSTQVITQGSGVTMYFVGTNDSGNRSVAQHGLATIVCVDLNIFVITGGGLT